MGQGELPFNGPPSAGGPHPEGATHSRVAITIRELRVIGELDLDLEGGPRTRKIERAALWSVLALAALVLLAGIFGRGGGQDAIARVTAPYGFDIARWELRYAPRKWLYAIGSWFKDRPDDQQRRRDLMRYFQLTGELNQLRGGLDQAVALAEDRSSLEAQISARDAEQRSLEPAVEAALEGELTALLEDLGLTDEVPIFGIDTVWPPVDFVVDDTPRVLVTSPRARIERSRSLLLAPDTTIEQSEAIEGAVEQQPDLSALVVGTGGVAFYPAVVRPSASLEQTLEVAAHEWVHHWLFFHPLGSRFFDGGDIEVINETVANIAGRELGSMLGERLAITVPAPEELGVAGAPANVVPIDARAEMRELRLEVDALLGSGRVEEAETLMEERRRFLAERGVFIRRINQAYFAFYGTYADTPASSNPLGPKIERIRNESASLTEFLRMMAGVTQPADIDRLLARG